MNKTKIAKRDIEEFPTDDKRMKEAGMNRAARLAMKAQLRRGGSKVDALKAARSASLKRQQ